MIEKTLVLRPISYERLASGKIYYEQILALDDNYPIFMVHCDLFWPGSREGNPQEKYDVYDALVEGNKIKVKVTFEIIVDEDSS